MCKPHLRKEKAKLTLKPMVLKLHACAIARRLFSNRLRKDIPFRLRYLFVHETEDPNNTHICWRKVPPRCISVYRGKDPLKKFIRLLRPDIEEMSKLLREYQIEEYNWVLSNYI